MTTKIRFVGGYWHNRILEVTVMPVIKLSNYIPNSEISNFQSVKYENYYLFTLMSARGARFQEYLHESLLSKGVPVEEVLQNPTFPRIKGKIDLAKRKKVTINE